MTKTTNTVKRVLSLTLWMSRGAATMVGFTVLLAVLLGVGTTALAAVPGDPFKLGRTNTIDKLTTLNGSVSDALMRINNNGSGPALDLQVEEGEAPMTVDSTIQVDDLNADQLDGQSASDFILFDGTYKATEVEIGRGGGTDVQVFVDCDPGDIILGGGGSAPFSSDLLRVSEPTVDGWRIVAQDNGDESTVVANAICAETSRR